MAGEKWQFLTATPDAPSGHALAEALAAGGITSKLVSDSVLLGEGRPFRIFVDRRHFHRAQQLLSQGECTEEELLFLATGGTADESPSRS